jgi:hypothetical protein
MGITLPSTGAIRHGNDRFPAMAFSSPRSERFMRQSVYADRNLHHRRIGGSLLGVYKLWIDSNR